MGRSKEINKCCFDSINNCPLSDIPISLCCELQRTTPGRSCMDRVGESIWETRILRWCNRCKHEVPDWILSDRCDWCGGEVVEIN